MDASRTSRWVGLPALLSLVVVLLGCGDDDALITSDAGTDAGADASLPVDAGTDGGAAVDAFVPTDAGPVCDPDCGEHGGCDFVDAVATCVCDEGYAGTTCDECATGYQDHDEDGICAVDCDTAALGCVSGTCDDTSGAAVCVCSDGALGTLCDVYPATCAEVLVEDPTAVDGSFTLFVDGDSTKPWTAYCADMDATPIEYLELVMVGDDTNYSSYITSSGMVRTDYTRVRIEPTELTVICGDETYSTSSGTLTHDSITVASMPYATAMNCDAGETTGLGHLDFRGTPFAVSDAFATGGAAASGDVTKSSDDQVVEITAIGFCGFTTPAPLVYNPINTHGGRLDLVYDASLLP